MDGRSVQQLSAGIYFSFGRRQKKFLALKQVKLLRFDVVSFVYMQKQYNLTVVSLAGIYEEILGNNEKIPLQAPTCPKQ